MNKVFARMNYPVVVEYQMLVSDGLKRDQAVVVASVEEAKTLAESIRSEEVNVPERIEGFIEKAVSCIAEKEDIYVGVVRNRITTINMSLFKDDIREILMMADMM